MKHKAGYVNIIGKPNVGKSTLMNAMVGEKLSIITSRAQTTRHRIHGILNTPEYQVIFSDTPGILDPSYKLQETMLKAMKKADSLRDQATLDTWLYRILLNNWHDYLRVQGRNVELYDVGDESQSEHADSYQQSQIVGRVRSSVERLPMPLREVVTLADFAGFSYAEIAEIVDIPIGTVMSRLHRARQNLKQQLLDLAGEGKLPVKLMRVK